MTANNTVNLEGDCRVFVSWLNRPWCTKSA